MHPRLCACLETRQATARETIELIGYMLLVLAGLAWPHVLLLFILVFYGVFVLSHRPAREARGIGLSLDPARLGWLELHYFASAYLGLVTLILTVGPEVALMIDRSELVVSREMYTHVAKGLFFLLPATIAAHLLALVELYRLVEDHWPGEGCAGQHRLSYLSVSTGYRLSFVVVALLIASTAYYTVTGGASVGEAQVVIEPGAPGRVPPALLDLLLLLLVLSFIVVRRRRPACRMEG